MPSKIQTLRRKAFDHQDGRCWYCGVHMWLASPDELSVARRSGLSRLRCTAEHLVPRASGGRDAPENVVAACLHCNCTRHRRRAPPEPTAYRSEVMRRTRREGWHPAWVFRLGLCATAEK
ncbi:HNH endonuclease [Roseateles sp. SL47]|uniref:HNH endonuclease n=1 Tax=Roseateles sp. SL47 TaxID=2995138 RepID=UPI003B640F1F